MAILPLPCTLFKTKHKMDDYGASDMRCGDLTESVLKNQFYLKNISNRTEPYKLTELVDTPIGMLSIPKFMPGKAISKQACINRLFDEMRELSSGIYTSFGLYSDLIIDLINHMQHKNGAPFRSFKLDRAIERQILDDRTEKSTRLIITQALVNTVDWEKHILPVGSEAKILVVLRESILPKFTRLRDRFNGLGLSVHDTYATHITLKSLHFDDKENFTAFLNYKIQDHFGLDDSDIRPLTIRLFNFFKIWFVLQRYNKFAIKPFMTNMEVTVKIRGNIRDREKK